MWRCAWLPCDNLLLTYSALRRTFLLLLLLPSNPAEDAEAWKAKGEAVILCRQETSPEDVGGMHAAEGILTSRGGMTSHAAVVARGWGKPCCCCGCEELIVDAFAKTLKAPVSDCGDCCWCA